MSEQKESHELLTGSFMAEQSRKAIDLSTRPVQLTTPSKCNCGSDCGHLIVYVLFPMRLFPVRQHCHNIIETFPDELCYPEAFARCHNNAVAPHEEVISLPVFKCFDRRTRIRYTTTGLNFQTMSGEHATFPRHKPLLTLFSAVGHRTFGAKCDIDPIAEN
jgi:hypothetical protein